jgi:hypothetical protein
MAPGLEANPMLHGKRLNVPESEVRTDELFINMQRCWANRRDTNGHADASVDLNLGCHPGAQMKGSEGEQPKVYDPLCIGPNRIPSVGRSFRGLYRRTRCRQHRRKTGVDVSLVIQRLNNV